MCLAVCGEVVKSERVNTQRSQKPPPKSPKNNPDGEDRGDVRWSVYTQHARQYRDYRTHIYTSTPQYISSLWSCAGLLATVLDDVGPWGAVLCSSCLLDPLIEHAPQVLARCQRLGPELGIPSRALVWVRPVLRRDGDFAHAARRLVGLGVGLGRGRGRMPELGRRVRVRLRGTASSRLGLGAGVGAPPCAPKTP